MGPGWKKARNSSRTSSTRRTEAALRSAAAATTLSANRFQLALELCTRMRSERLRHAKRTKSQKNQQKKALRSFEWK